MRSQAVLGNTSTKRAISILRTLCCPLCICDFLSNYVQKEIVNLMTTQILFSRTNSSECQWHPAHTGPSFEGRQPAIPFSVYTQTPPPPRGSPAIPAAYTTEIHTVGSVDFSE